MKRSFVTCAAVGALALAGVATTMPAQARGLGPAIAGAVVGGAIIAGAAASSAYAYGPGPYAYDSGPAYAYDSYAYDAGPGYYAPYEPHRYNRNTYGTWDQSAHGGQPTYSRPN
jgi:hypothetical protein